MKDPSPGPDPNVTELLLAWGGGDESALDQLVPLVHAELLRLARRQMRREQPGHTLQPTALVNEAFLRLVEIRKVRWQNRAQFLAIAARLMRRVLVDAARARRAGKRGGGNRPVTVDDQVLGGQEPGRDLVALHDALEALAAVDERKHQVVELRFFGGLSVEETAAVLSVSPETVMRDWKTAKLWLLRELARSSGQIAPRSPADGR